MTKRSPSIMQAESRRPIAGSPRRSKFFQCATALLLVGCRHRLHAHVVFKVVLRPAATRPASVRPRVCSNPFLAISTRYAMLSAEPSEHLPSGFRAASLHIRQSPLYPFDRLHPDQPLQNLSLKLSLPAPKTGPPEPRAANSLDRRSDWNVRICKEKRRWPKC